METLGIYVQVPFCASKCSFCNFSSQVAPAKALDAYAQALEREIERLPDFYEASQIGQGMFDLPVDTLYFGGGTPSLLGVEQLGIVLSGLRRRFHLAESLEFTFEMTPGSADDSFLGSARQLGVNRLSIGAQSFDDHELRAVGRLHAAADTRDLVNRARRAGVANISLDLIAGLPYQSQSSWLRSVLETVRLEPDHVSVYLFEVDDKSRLGSEVLRHGQRYHAAQVPDDEFMAEAYEFSREILLRTGYVQYEISNFARPGYESRHNRRYWRLEPYVGLGAGAHSFDGHCRWANETALETYRKRLGRGASPIAEKRVLSVEEQIEEFFFLGLRQHDGIELSQATQRWGSAPMGRWESTICRLERDGMIERRLGRLRIPDRVYLVSNEIFQQFLM